MELTIKLDNPNQLSEVIDLLGGKYTILPIVLPSNPDKETDSGKSGVARVGVIKTEDWYIGDTLRQLGVKSHVLGYQYLIEAIKMVLNDRTYLNSITTRLYPDIADNNDVTSERVERAIRSAITMCYVSDTINDELFEKILGYSMAVARKKPTNSQIIAAVSDYIQTYPYRV